MEALGIYLRRMKPETKFRKNKIDPFLASLGPDCYVDAISQKGKSGTPDYYISLKGHFIALEAKVGKNKPTPLQSFVLGKILRSGGTSWVVTPENWEQVKAHLTKIAKGESR